MTSTHECCCGNPECTDFEDRMQAWGIPLSELTEIELVVPLIEPDPNM